MTSERQSKQAAVALLACMAAVALTLWGWPSSPLRTHQARRADVALPAAAGVPGVVTGLQVKRSDPRPLPANVDRPSSHSAARGDVRPGAPVRAGAAEAAAPLEAAHFESVGERLSDVAVMPIASRTLALPMRPLLPEAGSLPVRAAAPGNPFAHAGVALGSAFRRAGVNTGAAFSHIF